MSRTEHIGSFRRPLVIGLAIGVTIAGLLGWWLGQRQKPTPTLSGEPLEVKLGTLASENIPSLGEWQRKGDEVIVISPDRSRIAIAGHDELVHLFDVGGREKWSFPIPESYGRALAFSTDSKMVYVGECSMDGTIYAIDVSQGKKKWAYSVGDDVGRPAQNQAVTNRTLDKCCVFALVASEDALFAVGTHRDRRLTDLPTGARVVNDILDTVLYAFHPASGKLLWRYPAQETMDTHMPYPVYSKTLGHVVGANTSYWREGTPVERYPNGSVRLINTRTGVESCSYRIMPSWTSFTSIWYSLSVSPNGQFLSAGTTDGRLVLFAVKEGPFLEKVWEKNVSTLLEISGIPIYSCCSDSIVFDNGDIFVTTSSTHAKQTGAGIVRQPPGQHPDSNTAFLLDRHGRTLWKWKAPGDIADVRAHLESGLIAVVVQHNYVGKSLDASGFYFMQYKGGKASSIERLGSLQLSGISTSGAMSPDGSFFSGIELPIRLADETLMGAHKLHIVPTRFLADRSADE
ncbi:WD40 repeat domain-containing protein [Desulfobacca acetoxidans]